VLFLLGEIAAHRQPVDIALADERYQDALRLTEQLGMRPLAAHCHASLARLYRRSDNQEQAQIELAIATTMYREMRMTYWLEKAEAHMMKLGS
jgi:hypothetical protein